MLDKYLDRFRYLSLGDGDVGEETYGWERYLNQSFYRSRRWKSVRDAVIIRDNGMDMGLDGHPIFGKIIVHHINPIAPWHIKHQDPGLYDMDNLVCVSHMTHNAIHYGSEKLLPSPLKERRPGDTSLW